MMNKMGIALLGTGRMAHVYGPKINAHPGLSLEVVYNPRLSSAKKAVALYGGRALDDFDRVLVDPGVDAVLVATPTNTHLEYIEKAARAGKAIYCEKPLDQTLELADRAVAVLRAHPVPFMLGFNRRFDPENSRLKHAVHAGEIGTTIFLLSTSREPAPPPIDYVRTSGGYFVDGVIHDIDLMCWIAGELPKRVYSAGSCKVDPAIGAAGDFDTAMTILEMPSGAMVHINNSRGCAYGFDQRVEVFGSAGMVQTVNHRDDNLVRWGVDATEARQPLKSFFLERYDQSFFIALDEFYAAVTSGRAPSTTQDDGHKALVIALACTRSAQDGKAAAPNYDG